MTVASFDNLIRVHDPARIRIKRHHVEIGREQRAVAVEDIGTGGDCCSAGIDPCGRNGFGKAVLDQSRRNDAIDNDKDGDQYSEPLFRVHPAAGSGTEDSIPALKRTSLNNKMRPAFQPHQKAIIPQ